MRKLILVQFVVLAACSTPGSRAPQSEEAQKAALAKQFLGEANRYCLEAGEKAGTQHFNDCVMANGLQRVAQYKVTEIAANPVTAPVYSPAPAPVYQPQPCYIPTH